MAACTSSRTHAQHGINDMQTEAVIEPTSFSHVTIACGPSGMGVPDVFCVPCDPMHVQMDTEYPEKARSLSFTGLGDFGDLTAHEVMPSCAIPYKGHADVDNLFERNSAASSIGATNEDKSERDPDVSMRGRVVDPPPRPPHGYASHVLGRCLRVHELPILHRRRAGTQTLTDL